MILNPKLSSGWELTRADKAFAAELAGRLPERIFDVHAHFYCKRDLGRSGELLARGPERADLAAWRKYVGGFAGGKRLVGALCTPMPTRKGSREAANQFVLDMVRGQSDGRATVVVAPQDDPGAVEAMIEANPGVVGLKPYHFFLPGNDTFQAPLEKFVPRWMWELAQRRRLVILLHMVRDAALADRGNQRRIRAWCEAYPAARLILAHAARGFHAANTAKGIGALRGLENVWFDTSAVCEADAIAAILDQFGTRRAMWGSDFPVCRQRGRCVSLGTGFAWVATDQIRWTEGGFKGEPVLVGLEALKANLDAGDRFGLKAGDLDDLFCDNACRLLGLRTEPGHQTQALYEKARRLIPGGVQLLSKRPEMFAPGQWPAYFREARGCEVWDLDDRHYYDCSSCAVGSTLLGYADPDVNRAVLRRMRFGNQCMLSSADEVALAERLVAIHPWAEQVRYARTGGEAMAIAVRIARATTDRSVVAVCGYHGWHDWYLAGNLGEDDALRGHLLPGLDPLGVPRELRGTCLTFTYGNREELDRIVREHGDRLAAVVMEPCRFHDPEPGFLEFVRDRVHQARGLLVFDEITIGWRFVHGGAHLKFGVNPDIAVFSKALANGYPMAAIIGTRPAMEGAHTSFISSTYWTEGIGPAAALATIEKLGRVGAPAHAERMGRRVQEAWRRAAAAHRVPLEVGDGYPCLSHGAFKHEMADALKTLYVQGMLERGFLAGLMFYPNMAHTDAVLDRYEAAIDEVLGWIGEALRKGDVEAWLKGPVAHSTFRRLL